MDIFIGSYQEISRKIYSIFLDKFTANSSSDGLFSCVISGGRGPLGFFRIANLNFKDFDKVDFFISDERLTTEKSELNYISIEASLFDKIENFRFNKINPFVIDPCIDYEAKVEKFIKTAKFFDMAILGIGADGHIASLFQKDYATDRFVIKTQAPLHYKTKQRVSLNFSALNLCKMCVFVVSGEEKSELKKNIKNGFIDHYPFSAVKTEKVYLLEYD